MDSTKADKYKLYKNMQKIENYFDHIKNIKHLKAFIKFRISDHKFINRGRKKKKTNYTNR